MSNIKSIEKAWKESISTLNKFHTTLISLSSGSIILTISLINLKPIISSVLALQISWICFAVSILLSLLRSFAQGHSQYNYTVSEVLSVIKHPKGPNRARKRNIFAHNWDNISKISHYASPVAFVIGMIFLITFGFEVLNSGRV